MAKRTQRLLPFGEHLDELRKRLIIAAGSVVLAFAVIYPLLGNRLFQLMSRPVTALEEQGIVLQTLAPFEIFTVVLKISFIAAVIASSPIVIQQAWAFVSPGLTEREVRAVRPVLAGGVGLFAVGSAFCYAVVLPPMYAVLVQMNVSAGTRPLWSAESVISSALGMMLAFGVSFEMPMVVLLLTRLGIVTPKALARNRKYALLIIVIAAAIITPSGDLLSLALLSVPLYLLYELGIVLSRIATRKRATDLAG